MLDKTYRPAEVEDRIYALWEAAGAFAADTASDADPYTIMIPPPNVTGSLHMGHALTFTLQDILIRYHRMRSRDALWQPGTDHAGIATQMVVERQLAEESLTRHDLGRDEFIQRVWQWKKESGGEITRQLRRLGASLDWDKERFTMDEGMSKAVTKVFVDLHKEGLIYRDKRLVNWDPKLHTAISDLEVEQRETVGQMWYFKYPIEGQKGRFVTVGTTRPETMLGDTAVAVHPEDERYQDLVGKKCVLPIADRSIVIVADEYADPEKGTGAVKITPAHDFNDFEVGRRNDLELINVLDLDARMNENVPVAYQGLDRMEARDKVVAEMESLGLLEKVEDNPMTIPYGDRSGVVIEPWLMDQWFVKAEVLAKEAIKAVEDGRVEFVPKRWENTYFEWMRNIQPWCISRQIWWGHRIPAWYGPDGKIFVEESEEAAEKAALEHYGEKADITRDDDVLDTWFSSGLWPFSTLGWPEKTPELKRYYPGDVLVTGFDIIFFWVARMIMMGLHFMGDAPFRTVYIHALVRDEKGQKMSKSKGNVIDPLIVAEKHGTDALRFTLAAMAAQGRDVKLSEGRIEGYRNFVTKLWNASRFAQMNGCERVPDFDPKTCSLTLNRWIISHAERTAQSVDKALCAYRFNDAADSVYHFTWGIFCDWYLELTKPVFQSADKAAIAETQATTAFVLDRILHLLHPFMPYVTEELWGKTASRKNLLMSEPWTAQGGDCIDQDAEAEIDWVVRLVSEIRGLRSEMNVPAAAKVPLLFKNADADTQKRLDVHRDVISRLARIAEMEPLQGTVSGAVQMVLDDTLYAIPLSDVIDVPAEKTRLEKEIGKTIEEIAKIDKKLSNEGFLAKAPSAVIKEQKERRTEAEKTRLHLVEALGRLEAL
jgi:valyl-tRNA synthetase